MGCTLLPAWQRRAPFPEERKQLLAEDLSEELTALLHLFTSDRAGRHWTDCLDMICELRGLASDDDAGRLRIVKDLNAADAEFRNRFPNPVTDLAAAKLVVTFLIDFIGKSNILAVSPGYRQGDWFDKVATAAALHIEASCRGANTWFDALDVYEGVYAIPLMTIHKSKGLEYHTVIFVGLDDGAWWSFEGDKQEATAGFFVAFTRAKQRVVLSYFPARGTRTKIAALYDLLIKAGVKTIKFA